MELNQKLMRKEPMPCTYPVIPDAGTRMTRKAETAVKEDNGLNLPLNTKSISSMVNQKKESPMKTLSVAMNAIHGQRDMELDREKKKKSKNCSPQLLYPEGKEGSILKRPIKLAPLLLPTEVKEAQRQKIMGEGKEGFLNNQKFSVLNGNGKASLHTFGPIKTTTDRNTRTCSPGTKPYFVDEASKASDERTPQGPMDKSTEKDSLNKMYPTMKTLPNLKKANHITHGKTALLLASSTLPASLAHKESPTSFYNLRSVKLSYTPPPPPDNIRRHPPEIHIVSTNRRFRFARKQNENQSKCEAVNVSGINIEGTNERADGYE